MTVGQNDETICRNDGEFDNTPRTPPDPKSQSHRKEHTDYAEQSYGICRRRRRFRRHRQRSYYCPPPPLEAHTSDGVHCKLESAGIPGYFPAELTHDQWHDLDGAQSSYYGPEVASCDPEPVRGTPWNPNIGYPTESRVCYAVSGAFLGWQTVRDMGTDWTGQQWWLSNAGRWLIDCRE